MKEKGIKKINFITIGFILFLSGLWTFWGVSENFHEGWYFQSILKNLSLMFIQYLSIPTIIILLSLISIKWNKVGGILWIVLWIAFSYFIYFGGNIPFSLKRFLLWLPLTFPFFLIGISFYYYEIKNKKTAYILTIGVPVVIFLSLGIPNLIRIQKRYNDHNFGKRLVKGNRITLIWAPKGPGFPERGTNWYKAKEICSHLDESGVNISNKRKNIWRLPTRDELVRSLTFHNKNCGGYINKEGKPVYKIKPDKETPLWDPNSMIIYYWTSEAKDKKLSYLVSYNGRILARYASNGADYHGFRCVREVKEK